MRIAFLLPTLGPGGAERVASLLCTYWAEQGHAVTLITFEAEGAEGTYELDKRVSIRRVDALNRIRVPSARLVTNFRRLARIRAVFKGCSPDVIVAFTTEANIVAVLSAVGLSVPVVISERNQPDRPGLGRFTLAMRRLSYELATALVFQSEALARWGRKRFRVPVHVLPNPVQLDAWREGNADRSGKRLIAVGRLVRQKGFDLLIESFERIAGRHAGWMLRIYGEGPERETLAAQIAAVGLAERVELPGVRNDISVVLAGADLLVLPSRFEGYPNVLLEALAAGLPVIATDCPGATAEIAGGGRYALLVPPENVEALSEALDRMMESEELRARFAGQARDAVSALDVAQIGRRWLDLLGSLASDR